MGFRFDGGHAWEVHIVNDHSKHCEMTHPPVNGMRPIHPGEVLREEFLLPFGLTAHAVAMALQVPALRINDIVRERRAVTVDTAMRLAKFFGTSAEFWLGLQTDFDMAQAREPLREVLRKIDRFEQAACASPMAQRSLASAQKSACSRRPTNRAGPRSAL